MEGTTADCAAFDETIVFLGHFNGLEDPRAIAAKPRARMHYFLGATRGITTHPMRQHPT